MGKRYYCDFCDKSFADNPTNRKNHLKGVIHHRIKKSHYDSFRDAKIILNEELSKRPCKHFLSSGNCTFLDNCKYSHLTQERREQLEKEIRDKEESSKQGKVIEFPSVESWLEKRTNKQPKETKKQTSGIELPVYTVPAFLQSVPNLPLSLFPPPTDVYQTLTVEEWG